MVKKQEGFAHRGMIALAVVVMAIIGLVGYKVISSQSYKQTNGPAQNILRIKDGPEISDGGVQNNTTSKTKSDEGVTPTLYLPYSTSSNLPTTMTPMGETIYHPKPQNPYGHGGIDFQWEKPSTVPTITASMEATVTSITNNPSHPGAYDVSTRNGKWGVDYDELGSVNTGLEVGDSIKVGDIIGTPQHPVKITDQPYFRMIHWQFGYAGDTRLYKQLCPLFYFTPSAKTSI